MILASPFLKYDFKTVAPNLWKSETPVSIKAHAMNFFFFMLVNIRPIQDGLLEILKQVGHLVSHRVKALGRLRFCKGNKR